LFSVYLDGVEEQDEKIIDRWKANADGVTHTHHRVLHNCLDTVLVTYINNSTVLTMILGAARVQAKQGAGGISYRPALNLDSLREHTRLNNRMP
jgi:hypothetical protein